MDPKEYYNNCDPLLDENCECTNCGGSSDAPTVFIIIGSCIGGMLLIVGVFCLVKYYCVEKTEKPLTRKD